MNPFQDMKVKAGLLIQGDRAVYWWALFVTRNGVAIDNEND
jgi:hypothetical protein